MELGWEVNGAVRKVGRRTREGDDDDVREARSGIRAQMEMVRAEGANYGPATPFGGSADAAALGISF